MAIDPGSSTRIRHIVHQGVIYLCTAAVALLLVVLAAKAILHLETWWDSPAYHLPFAARYGGLGVRYTMDHIREAWFRGFPPLPFLLRGLLWRVTGSANATGIINYLAFLTFLLFARSMLKARFGLVAMIALTAPMVLIHTATTYYDLFGNCFLAIGFSGIAGLFLLDRWQDRTLLVWTLTGLTVAAWSKYFMLPPAIGGFGFLAACYAIFGWRRRMPMVRPFLVFIGAFALVAALPYLKNWILFGNPLWPYRTPLFGNVFPFQIDLGTYDADFNRPPPLTGFPRYKLFIYSLFEINHPTFYSYRERWIVDQGQGYEAFRAGGFWGRSVICFLGGMWGLSALFSRRKALWLIGGTLGVLACVAVLPKSQDLRYFLFIPLTWAAIIGLLENRLSQRWPLVTTGFVAGCAMLFGYMMVVNRAHYQVHPLSYTQAAQAWGAAHWWESLEPNASYCLVNTRFPIGFYMTGPTLREFAIHDRFAQSECPEGSVILDWQPPPVPPPEVAAKSETLMAQALDAEYTKHDHARAIERFHEILGLRPEHFGALFQLGKALDVAGDKAGALAAWRATKRLALLRGYEGETSAYASARIQELSKN